MTARSRSDEDKLDASIKWMFSDEGQAEYKKYLDESRAAYHAARFDRAASRHDCRIPRKTRIAVLKRANEHCERCDRFIATGFSRCLELHHVTYDRAYGEELPKDLLALCSECHRQKHGIFR